MQLEPLPAGWVVVAPDGFQSLFKPECRARAEQYAVACHGVIEPLFRATKQEEAPCSPH